MVEAQIDKHIFFLYVLEQYKKVKEFVKVAQEEGATLICGGKRPEVSATSFILMHFIVKTIF